MELNVQHDIHCYLVWLTLSKQLDSACTRCAQAHDGDTITTNEGNTQSLRCEKMQRYAKLLRSRRILRFLIGVFGRAVGIL